MTDPECKKCHCQAKNTTFILFCASLLMIETMQGTNVTCWDYCRHVKVIIIVVGKL